MRVAGADRAGKEDRGAISIYLIIFFIPLLMGVGLVVDGGRKVEAIGQARDLADNAARIGAQQVAETGFRSGSVVPIDQSAATAAVAGFLAGTEADLDVVRFPAPGQIEVEVSITVDYVLLPGGATVRGGGSADTEQG